MRFPASPRHAGRYAELARLFLRYGRGDIVRGLGLDDLAEPEDLDVDPAKADALTADLERMGPTYIKFGQLLASRVDLLPAAYTQALARLQDQVEPVPFSDIEQVITTELGVDLRHAFTSFEERPLAAASLGQVHRAELRSGRQVVVKVQRPGIRAQVLEDMRALTELAEFADAHTTVGRRYGLTALVDQFHRSLVGELDYHREAANLVRIGADLARYRHLVIPRPVEDYTTSTVLTMDFIPGRKVTELGPLARLDLDVRPLIDDLFNAYLTMIVVSGFFHADPHPGNVLLTPDHRLGLIDLGMVATIPPRLQDGLVKLLLAISDGNGEEAASVLAGMGRREESFDGTGFTDAVNHLITNGVTAGSDVQAGTLLLDLSRRSGAAGLRPPPEMAMVGKALLNLEEVTRHLDPAFAPAEALRGHLTQVIASRSRLGSGGLLAAAMEAKDFSVQLPGRLNRVMDALAAGSFELKVQAIDEVRLLHVLQRLANRLAAGLVIAALVVGAALMMQIPTRSRILGYPSIAMVFFLLAALGAATLLLSMLGMDRRIARRSKARQRQPR